jgi:hypothetical protein
MSHVERFQDLNLTQISGCVHRWSTSTSLRSHSVRMICTSSFFSPGFQHERSRLLRKSAAHSSSWILGALAWSAPCWRAEPCFFRTPGEPFAAAFGDALLAAVGVPPPAHSACVWVATAEAAGSALARRVRGSGAHFGRWR